MLQVTPSHPLSAILRYETCGQPPNFQAARWASRLGPEWEKFSLRDRIESLIKTSHRREAIFRSVNPTRKLNAVNGIHVDHGGSLVTTDRGHRRLADELCWRPLCSSGPPGAGSLPVGFSSPPAPLIVVSGAGGGFGNFELRLSARSGGTVELLRASFWAGIENCTIMSYCPPRSGQKIEPKSGLSDWNLA